MVKVEHCSFCPSFPVCQMDYGADDYQVHKALQQVNLADPPLIKR